MPCSMLNREHQMERSPFIQMVGICTSGNKKWIIMEQAHCSLRELISAPQFQGSMMEKLAAARAGVQALKSLPNALHCDLHSGNILVSLLQQQTPFLTI